MSNDNNEHIEVLPEDHTKFDLVFKIIIIGNSGVGKSCLSLKATKNVFNNESQTTLGVEFFTWNIMYKDKAIKLQIWDTCGQEIYRSLITSYYKNASLAVIVYAINDKNSFEDIEMWIKEVRTYSNPDIKLFLIGNKKDLEEMRQVKKEEGEKMFNDYKMNHFMETSAKDGDSAREILVEATKVLCAEASRYQKIKEQTQKEAPKTKVVLEKGVPATTTQKKKCCHH